MSIAAGDAGAGAGGRQEGAAAEGTGAAHVVVDVDMCAAAAAAAAAGEEEVAADDLVLQLGGGSGCRICHLGDGELPAEKGSGKLVRLGCGCRGELAAAHRRCAEAWFAVRGNRRCEICGEDATNVIGWGGGGKEFMQRWHQTAGIDGGGDGDSPKACGFCRSQSFCNLLIACLIIVFVLPWFLHNHIF